MRNGRSSRPSPAFVLSALALFVALGGSAYATHTHKMGTEDLHNHAVTTPKIGNAAVATSKVRPAAVTFPRLHPSVRERVDQPPAGVAFRELDDSTDLSAETDQTNVGEREQVGVVTVDAGSHIINGQVMLFSPDAPSHSGLCELEPEGQERVSVANAALGTGPGKVDRSVMTLTGAVTVEEPTEVALMCRIDGPNRGGTMLALDVSMTGVAVSGQEATTE